jgi:hypothetical protein
MNKLKESLAVSHEIHTYAELRHQIHDDLRIQHPEWVEPSGEAPMCDFYEARLMGLLHSDAKGLN